MKKYLSIFKTYILVFALIFISSLLVGCGQKEKEDDPVKEVYNIEVDLESFEKEYDIDDFSLNLLKLKRIYTDGSFDYIDVNENMFDEGDNKKLKSVGNKKVNLVYQEGTIYFDTDVIVKIVDYSINDEGLNRNKEYSDVIKVIRNKETNRLEWILEPVNPIAGLQARYDFDSNKISLSDFKVENSSDYFNYKIEDGKLSVYFASLENIETERVLFSCKFEGDFRNSNLLINEDFANRCYEIKGDTTQRVNSILYHVSKK